MESVRVKIKDIVIGRWFWISGCSCNGEFGWACLGRVVKITSNGILFKPYGRSLGSTQKTVKFSKQKIIDGTSGIYLPVSTKLRDQIKKELNWIKSEKESLEEYSFELESATL